MITPANLHSTILRSHLKFVPPLHRVFHPQADQGHVEHYLRHHPLPIIAHLGRAHTLGENEPITEPPHEFVYANNAALRLFRFPSEQELIGRHSHTVLPAHPVHSHRVHHVDAFKDLRKSGYSTDNSGYWRTKYNDVFRSNGTVFWNLLDEVDGDRVIGYAGALVRNEKCPWFYDDEYHKLHLDEF
ncbi:hypothetical protein BC830DRAFT_1166044 [Chytriomyces sp. MP71]|nr:hypothetical protein BC830DRAFT_1166044 [Chytriomyces sp. MP71]